ncbi:MAG: hypothetical protein ACO2ZP_06635 [Bacteriovoracaceae bacterium]
MLTLLAMFGGIADGAQILATIEIYKVATVILLLVGCHWYMRESHIEFFMEKLPKWSIALLWGLMIFAIIIAQGGNNAFIYFQF